jgi:hypothetical protein
MLDVIAVRVVLFLVVFLVLGRALRRVSPGPSLIRSLLVLGVATLVAFAGSALAFEESLSRALIGWAVIYGLIAGLWFIRARGRQYESLRRQAELPAPDDEPKARGPLRWS